jgi:hypothetical protein
VELHSKHLLDLEGAVDQREGCSLLQRLCAQ